LPKLGRGYLSRVKKTRDTIIQCIRLMQWFPTGGSQPQSGSRRSFCGVANSSLNSLLKSRIFELRISTSCYISKTETRTDLCEVHIISIIIPIWFLLYSLNQPDCRIESWTERVNPHGLRVPAFAGQVREPILLCMRGGRRMENSLCGQLNVEPKHMNLRSWKTAKHVDVLKLFASNALRPVSPEQLLHYDVTTYSCETLAHALVMW